MIGRKHIRELASLTALIMPLTNVSLAQPSSGDGLPPNSVYNLQVLVEDQLAANQLKHLST